MESELERSNAWKCPRGLSPAGCRGNDESRPARVLKYTQLGATTPWDRATRFIGASKPSSIEEVKEIVFGASYLVLGLGDVYLGAPVATPLDPRHRLVTTKYNPARTWTPENAVGIGGAYLCIYGMEGPGGYQLVGRTVQVYNRFRRPRLQGRQSPGCPVFDKIRFSRSRDRAPALPRRVMLRRVKLAIEDATFKLAMTSASDEKSGSLSGSRRAESSFNAERSVIDNGQLNFSSEEETR